MSEQLNQNLQKMAAKGDLEAVKEALEQGADLNAKARFGDTALNKAAEEGHLEVVKFLVESDADINNLGGADKTPLMNASLFRPF